jgi:hypothetical protein
VVLQQAWEEIGEKVEQARQKVLSGEASLLYYYMEKNLMDATILSGYVDTLPFMVSLHMKPFFFRKLGRKTLEKYAYAFRIPLAEMMDTDRIRNPQQTATKE